MSQRPEPLPPEAYARVFDDRANPEGAAILEELTRRFCRRAVRTGGIDAVLNTYFNDGARSVVEFIVAQLNRANGIEENPDD